MKKSLSILVVVISLILMGGNQIHAGAPEWKFDPAHSRFYFTIDHIYAKVIGYFEDFSGTFYFDPDNLEESKINIEIKAKSINTNIRKRDNHLRSDDFFGVKKYPLITFVSKRISHKEGNQYDVEGDLTIKDVTKSLVLPLTYFGTRDNPLQKGEVVAGFEARFNINRLDYHVGSGKFHQMGVAGKDVDITVSLEMLRKK
ncbi:polyisoprenoid-binding protein [bacterium]|nr:MAG: polyisoprenoid-binding protein [bacterium]